MERKGSMWITRTMIARVAVLARTNGPRCISTDWEVAAEVASGDMSIHRRIGILSEGKVPVAKSGIGIIATSEGLSIKNHNRSISVHEAASVIHQGCEACVPRSQLRIGALISSPVA